MKRKMVIADVLEQDELLEKKALDKLISDTDLDHAVFLDKWESFGVAFEKEAERIKKEHEVMRNTRLAKENISLADQNQKNGGAEIKADDLVVIDLESDRASPKAEDQKANARSFPVRMF